MNILQIVCIGPQPSTTQIKLLSSISPTLTTPVSVKPTLQVSAHASDGVNIKNIFAVGDIADTAAAKAARPAIVQTGVVARNIARLIEAKNDALETYTPDPPGIHLTLGLVSYISHRQQSQ